MNYCPECQVSWCHICNSEYTKNLLIFGAVENTCMSRGLGAYTCNLIHFCRFTIDSNGRRQLRPDMDYWYLAFFAALFYIIYTTVLALLWYPFKWTFRATKNTVRSCWCIIFAPILVLLFYLFYLTIGFGLFFMIPGYQVFTVWCAIFFFAKTPLTRAQASNDVKKGKIRKDCYCKLCFSVTAKETGRLQYCPECDETWCHMCNMIEKKEKWFFNTFESNSCKYGSLVCDFMHWCRFTQDRAGRR